MIRKGFTLLEILIAMSIFAVIGLASYGVLHTTINSNQESRELGDKLEQLQRAMMYIERDILQAVPRPVRINGEANDKVISGGANQLESEADGLLLVHAGWHNPQLILPRSTLQAVGYRLRDSKLERLYGNYLDNVIGYEPKVKALLDNVEDFQVQFVAGGTTDAHSSQLEWKDSYVGTTLPRAIAIEIKSKDFGLIRREFLLAGQGSAKGAGDEKS